MWLLCLECSVSSGCGCDPPPKVKYVPRDHEKELKLYLEDIEAELTPKYRPNKLAINKKRIKDEKPNRPH